MTPLQFGSLYKLNLTPQATTFEESKHRGSQHKEMLKEFILRADKARGVAGNPSEVALCYVGTDVYGMTNEHYREMRELGRQIQAKVRDALTPEQYRQNGRTADLGELVKTLGLYKTFEVIEISQQAFRQYIQAKRDSGDAPFPLQIELLG